MIGLTGGVAIWLTQQSNDKIKKWAPVFGLMGQPFWFYASYTGEQWGVFCLSFFYCYGWLLGFKNNWLNSR